jgi:hypothetical protein
LAILYTALFSVFVYLIAVFWLPMFVAGFVEFAHARTTILMSAFFHLTVTHKVRVLLQKRHPTFASGALSLRNG